LTDPPSDTVDKSAYRGAVANDLLRRAREVISMIRASGRRRDAFMETIKSGNRKGWYKSPLAKVPENELLRDVSTRWDSVYFMLNRLRALRLVSTYILP
jgi:hypothetical protein